MISVTVLTKNSERYLREVLEALCTFDEVLIYDNGSSDQTLSIVAEFSNTTLVTGPFEGFGPTHNIASKAARNDWILSIDSDEIVTPEMAQEICALQLNPRAIYSFSRHNEYNAKWIYSCGWSPDRQWRLYNRTVTRFTDAAVHEGLIRDGCVEVSLKGVIRHYSYRCHSDFLQKMQLYSTLFAQQNVRKKQSSPLKAVGHAVFAFFKSYLLKRGILQGYEGLVISVYNANTALYKYLKLYEANQAVASHQAIVSKSGDDPKKMAK